MINFSLASHRMLDNIFILNSLIQPQKLKKINQCMCYFVDYTKAFDYINWAALYYKLVKRGIQGNY